ncbi:hybrid sensor histidine kinase/response regulator [Accumulibacter sp.]|uniref:hybrid sensor histidine kinase/response regulator n=1 Tax=Accumulibacter sp. TaxID=2053492 RepID=UPI0026074E9D|nr:hybrid sensor histidine kinase/response regulator [Accumulibacter sp.]
MKTIIRVCAALALLGAVLELSAVGAQEPTQTPIRPNSGPQIKFEHLTPDDGLSQGTVEALLQDRQGFLWIGTWDGLNRYDGYSFRVFKANPHDPHSLSGNLVHAIYEDSQGTLWISTNNGLNRFDRQTEHFTRYQHDPKNPRSLSQNAVWSIHEDRSGALWVGPLEKGINRLNRETGDFVRYEPDSVDPRQRMEKGIVFAITEDPAGILWVATSMGLYRSDRERKALVRYQTDPNDPHSLSNSWLLTVYIDRLGTVWTGTWGAGLNKHDPGAAKFRLYQHKNSEPNSLINNNVTSILQDNEGKLWFGTMTDGLSRFDRTTNTYTHFRANPNAPDSLTDNQVMSLYQDREGYRWVGTHDGGLNQFDRKTGKFIAYKRDPNDPGSLGHNDVRGIVESDDGTLWVATTYGGLNQWDRQTGKFRRYKHDPNDANSLGDGIIYTLRKDAEGMLWLGLWGGGLNKFDPKTRTFKRYKRHSDEPGSSNQNEVWAIGEDAKGNLWIGTSQGLEKFDRKTETFTRYGEKDGLASNSVVTIVEDNQGALWIGTRGGGLSRFDPRTGAFRNYDKHDGLQGNDFYEAVWKTDDGELYFGGVNGVNAFYPQEVKDSTFLPPIVITGFQVFNKPVAIGAPASPLERAINETEALTLGHEQSVFSLEFAALNYRFPDKNRYAYKLDGFDQDWNQVDSRRRFATYTNLDPGTYVFRVRASNNDGIWSEQEKSVRIVILPPWWKTVWFRVLLIVFSVALLVAAYRHRVSFIQRRNRELELQVAERTRALSEQTKSLAEAKDAAESANKAKSVFLANMSHELRTPLNAVLGFSDVLLRDAQVGREHLSPSQRKHLATVHRSGEHLLTLINNVLELSRIEAGRSVVRVVEFDLHELLAGLRGMFSLKAEEKGLSFGVERSAATPRYVSCDEVKLRQILINLLGNAFKFTERGGISLAVSVVGGEPANTGARLRFEVSDTGLGIAADELEQVFVPFVQAAAGQRATESTGLGLAICRQFVELMGGTIHAESTLGVGSVFSFEVPVQHATQATAETATEKLPVLGLEAGQPACRILVVDDDIDNRRLLLSLLEPLGFELAEAGDGQQAVDLWQSWRPQLIWMDMRMPGMDGREATRRIKATAGGHETRIIALTASSFEEERKEILAAGCDDFLRKPFRESELLAMMARQLGVRYVRGLPTPPPAEQPTLDAAALAAALRSAPAEWLTRLDAAAVRGQIAEVDGLIDQARAFDPALASTLARFADDLDYGRIAALTGHAMGHKVLASEKDPGKDSDS